MKNPIAVLSIALFIFLAALAIACDTNQCNHENGACDKSCGAECAQNSDCSCPSDGCAGQDYYEYNPVCGGDCSCQCTPVISYNDGRCMTCDPCNVDCSIPACQSNPKCLSCDPNNVDCTLPACAGNALCASCDSNNVDCNVLACANMPQCLPCDTSNVNCNLPSCASNPACAPSTPPSGGIGGMIVSGGYIPPIIGPITTPIICGDGTCSYNETCASCPKDCLRQGSVCCNSIAYFGNCCTDSDCGTGYECNMSKECQPVSKACNESWACSDWSDCNKVAQSRVCIDANSCGSIKERPDLVQKCSAPGPTGLFLQNSALLEALALGITMFTILFFWRRHQKGTVMTPPAIVS